MKFEQNKNYKMPDVSVSQSWETTRLRLLFLLPMAIAIFIIIFVLSAILYHNANEDVEEGVIKIRASVQEFYEESIRYDARALQALMHTLNKNEDLLTALAKCDRASLLRHAKPIYQDIRHDFDITHFYFTGKDRVNLLRVHAPLRYGDKINRVTTLQAQKSGSIAYGVELGPLGTFTLRLVSPWYDKKTNELIGYVELGMEIDQVLNKLQSFFGVQVFTLIHKKNLDKENWEKGMRTLGRTPNWDRFPNNVTSEQSKNFFPPLLAKQLVSGEKINNQSIIDLIYQGQSHRVTVLPLQNAAGQEVAQMLLLTNVSLEETTARQTVFAGSITALIVGGILFVFFYWLVGRIGERIEHNEKELRNIATHDGLTGLYNHRFFYTLLENEIARGIRYHSDTSLLLIDIDHFKNVNDTYGHRAGDTILHSLSKRLILRMRSTDYVCRYGGEEITVILSETNITVAQKIAEELRCLIEKESFLIEDGQSISITVSIGVSTCSEEAKDSSIIVSNADKALYTAKESGRNRICIFGQEVV